MYRWDSIDRVLIKEVTLFLRSLIERFHCNYTLNLCTHYYGFCEGEHCMYIAMYGYIILTILLDAVVSN